MDVSRPGFRQPRALEIHKIVVAGGDQHWDSCFLQGIFDGAQCICGTCTVKQITVAWAAWADRATATYYPVNTYFEVNNDTGAVVYPTTPAPDPDAE